MSRSKVEGTKIAQAAKDLNVTSVTIRRYIQEFEIETATDENGIKVLPAQALAELQEIRRLKEDDMKNPQVLEHLEEMRKKGDKPEKESKVKAKATRIAKPIPKAKGKAASKKAGDADDDNDFDEAESAEDDSDTAAEEAPKPAKFKAKGKPVRVAKEVASDDEDSEEDSEESAVAAAGTKSGGRGGRVAKPVVAKEAASGDDGEDGEDGEGSEGEDGEGGEDAGKGEGGERFMHTLVCQTCTKSFEHANPRLRDCLECYRAKRKERRRGGDKHKNVIANPLAQSVVNKAQQAAGEGANGTAVASGNGQAAASSALAPREGREPREARAPREGREREFKNRDSAAFSAEPRETREPREGREPREPREPREGRGDFAAERSVERTGERSSERSSERSGERQGRSAALAEQPTAWAQMQKPVRSYRKAIEETRLITGSLKRRLERPDLPEGERRWLEQIYAYQLILHQGWRHLSEYKSGSPSQAKQQQQAQEEA